MDYGQASHYIKHEGIYLFGGVCGKSASQQEMNSDIYYFPIGANVVKKWKALETKGQPPESRFHHSMHFYDKGNYLVVYGGRRFANPTPDIKYDSEFVNSISVLRVDSLEWSLVKYKKDYCSYDSFPELFNFSSALIDDQIVVFGGMQGIYSQSKNCYSISLPKAKSFYERPKTPDDQSELEIGVEFSESLEPNTKV